MAKKMRLLSLLLAIVMMFGLLAACGNSNTPNTPSTPGTSTPGTTTPDEPSVPERQTIKIAIATCFTGNAARGAETQLYGLQVALNQIAASGYSKYYDFELVKGDDMYDATEAVTVANKLVYQDEVKAVFGHLNAVVTLAALPIYEEAHIPCFTPSGSSAKIIESGYEYVYMTVPSDSIIAATLINYMVDDLGLTKLGLLYCNNDQGQSGLEYVERTLAEKNMKLTATETFVATDTDFTGQMLNFKAAGVETVIIWGGEVTQRSIMIQQARQLISNDILMASDGNSSNASFVSVTQPEERSGLLYSVAWSPAFTDEMSTTYIEDFIAIDSLKQTPGAVTVRMYDGMYLLATALNELGPYDVNADDFTEKLNEKIKEVSYQGLQGLLDPAENGECLNRGFVVRYNEEGNEELVK